MEPKFAVNEAVYAIATDGKLYPAVVVDYIWHAGVGIDNLTKESVYYQGYLYNLIYETTPLRLVYEKTLRKRYPPSDLSFDALMSSLKDKVVDKLPQVV